MCGEKWLRVLPDVLMVMRMLPRHPNGRSAYELAYKQVPRLPVPFEFAGLDRVEAPFVLDSEDAAE